MYIQNTNVALFTCVCLYFIKFKSLFREQNLKAFFFSGKPYLEVGPLNYSCIYNITAEH